MKGIDEGLKPLKNKLHEKKDEKTEQNTAYSYAFNNINKHRAVRPMS